MNRLTPIEFLRWRNFPSGKRQQIWLFKCECGKTIEAQLGNFKSNHTQSCGCYQAEKRIEAHTKHGFNCKGKTARIYTIFHSMLQRCNDPKAISYKYYGAKGIRVLWACFEDFEMDMGPTYADNLTIGRIDTKGHYCKENCKWETQAQQNRNYSRNVNLTLGDVTKCLVDWADSLGIERSTLQKRIYMGWSHEKALTTPVRCRIPE